MRERLSDVYLYWKWDTYNLAGTLVLLDCYKLKIFLETKCTAGSLRKSSLLNESIMAQVRAIALIRQNFHRSPDHQVFLFEHV
ncbi:hypothetical protein ElyMa_005612400 [Elysia marginata]|uniref:Uncharacterized protein n=1 Tax=Elysia marginata TaxID=1093978 RepID=A0AAV4F821_9GAST|nr:hypothetical protein ElyMa_005612400 [Elysia marginata]